MSGIRLYLLQTGTLRCKLSNIKMNRGDTPFEIPVPFYLLTHPQGHVLIDGGNAVETATAPRAYWGDIVDTYQPVMRQAEGCVAQIERLGIAKEEIRYVLQSHLHLDHSGAIGRFPNATHIVQKCELDYALAPDWFAAAAYVRQDFDQPALNWRLLDMEADDNLDVFGDGVLKIITTPGHAVGHQSFLVTLPRSGPIMLTIDAAYTLEHWQETALPGFLTSAIEAVGSVRKLRRIAAETGATVITGHDPDGWKPLKKVPDYYD